MRSLRSIDYADNWTGGTGEFLEDWSWLIANARRELLHHTRDDLKSAARESALRRDIPPPPGKAV